MREYIFFLTQFRSVPNYRGIICGCGEDFLHVPSLLSECIRNVPN